ANAGYVDHAALYERSEDRPHVVHAVAVEHVFERRLGPLDGEGGDLRHRRLDAGLDVVRDAATDVPPAGQRDSRPVADDEVLAEVAPDLGGYPDGAATVIGRGDEHAGLEDLAGDAPLRLDVGVPEDIDAGPVSVVDHVGSRVSGDGRGDLAGD